MHNQDPYQFPLAYPPYPGQWWPSGSNNYSPYNPMMAAQQQVKMEPLDIKTEIADSTVPSSPKKKKGAGRPKKLKQEKITDHLTVTKKKRDRFKGMSEEEVMARLLPDHLKENLDIVIVGINPGLFAAFVGHHYAGPGNHFWKCMFLSGLVPEQMNAMQDVKLLDYGIGFTNIVARTTRGSADLTRKEIKEGAQILIEKLRKFRPKIAVFNGKGIYEVFCGHKNFHFGKQPDKLEGTETAVYVMPSSSARCSQLPRAVDKVPFYDALKKLRDYLKGNLPDLDLAEVVFPDLELKTVKREVKTEPQPEQDNSGENSQQSLPDSSDKLSNFAQGSYQVIPHMQANSAQQQQQQQQQHHQQLQHQYQQQMSQQMALQNLPYGMIKQEPGTYSQANSHQSNSCSQPADFNNLNHPYPPYSINSQLHTSLQGIYGMVNSVAHPPSVPVGPTNGQMVQYSQALYGIVKEEKPFDPNEYGYMSGSSQICTQGSSQSPLPSTDGHSLPPHSLGNLTPSSSPSSSKQTVADYQTLGPAQNFPQHQPSHFPQHGQMSGYPQGGQQFPPGYPQPGNHSNNTQQGQGQTFVQMTNMTGNFSNSPQPTSDLQGQYNQQGQSGQGHNVLVKQEKQDDGYPC